MYIRVYLCRMLYRVSTIFRNRARHRAAVKDSTIHRRSITMQVCVARYRILSASRVRAERT